MKYLILGSGGTGGTVGAFLAKAGKDVTFIARGEHLETMQKKGLKVQRPAGDFYLASVKACDTEHYHETPDVIFVCVKGYSVKDILPFIRRTASKDTVVIPILNIFGTGREMQKELPGMLVTDGCIYVAAQRKEPGCILMKGDILRVIFGVRNPEESRPILKEIEKDLNESGILGVLSDNIRRDALLKFSYVSAQGTCGLYYMVPAGEIQKNTEIRECFAELVHEIDVLANAMGIFFEEDIVERNLKIIDDLDPSMTTSMQRDIEEGKPSEIEGLIYAVLRMGEEFKAELPEYKMIASALKERGIHG